MYQSLAAVRYSSRTGALVMASPRGMLDAWALDRSRLKKRIAAALFERSALTVASAIHATSEREVEDIRRFGLRQPVALVPNGVDVPRINRDRHRLDSSARTVLFLSRTHPKKGLDLLIRAWSAVEGRWPNWSLLVVGDEHTGYAAECRRLSMDLGTRSIIWCGAMHGSEKQRVLQEADLFVLPTHGENFGIAVAEALAHGVPVITTTNAPWSEVVERGCGWWIELSVERLVQTLDLAMGLDDAERREMGARGHAWMSSSFSWSAIGAQMSEVYRWLLVRGTRPSCLIED